MSQFSVRGRWLRRFAFVLVIASTVFVMPVAAQNSGLICGSTVGKSLANLLAQAIYSGYAVMTFLSIISGRFVSSLPFLPQDRVRKLHKWEKKVVGGAFGLYILLPIAYSIVLDAGVPFPNCIDPIPL